MTTTARLPADVEREDRLLSGLTGRQLLVLGAAVGVVSIAYLTVGRVAPAPLMIAMAGVVGLAAAVLAFARLDGLPGDRAAGLWLRGRVRPARLVPAPGGLPPVRGLGRRRDIGVLKLPVSGVNDAGVVDLGVAGSALVCRCSSLNFGLRTSEEQRALVATVSSWLNSLISPVQILVRAERVDVARLVEELERDAPALPHPDLETAARDHARFLSGLAARHDVLRREVLVVFRDAKRADAAVAAGLHRRAEDATSALGAAGIAVRALDMSEARAVLARSAAPDAPQAEGVLAWPADEIVRGVAR